jgi:DNA-binding CsgD family transcriptional regulator/PAS domain-containing protein
MSLHLSSHDLTRLGAATEALLAPAHGDPWAWWRGVETRVRELFPGSNVMLSMPEGDRLRNDSESIDDSARRRISELTAVDLSAGHFLIRDPAVEAWVAYRRQHRVEVWNTARNLRIIAEMGYDGDRSVFINEGLYAASMHGLCGLSYESPLGEAFLQVGYPRGRASRFADDSQLLALLLPAYRAGHHAAFGYARRESALAATLDAAGEALLVVAPDGRTLHRSAALVRLLSADPERDAVLRELDAAALALRAHAAARRGPLADGGPLLARGAARAVATGAARYTVRASFASELVWGTPGTVLVAVDAERALPAPAALPGTLGLTRREAEVARLLAERLSNAEVAAALGVSAHTARHHTERVMHKLGVGTRAEVAARLRAVV